jgi:hypothetical protein
MRNVIQYAAVGVFCIGFSRAAAATTLLVFISPPEAMIATDSLSNRLEGGQRLVCKVAQVSDHMLFVATGTGVTRHPDFNPYDLARISSMDGRSPREAASKYAIAALPQLQEIWRLNRARYFEMSATDDSRPSGPQEFIFVGLNRKGLISASGANFREDTANPPRLRVDEIHEYTGEHADDIFLFRSGVIEDLPSDKEISEWIERVGIAAALKRAIEVQIRATPNLVGGEISIVGLNRDGSISWLERGFCQEQKRRPPAP